MRDGSIPIVRCERIDTRSLIIQAPDTAGAFAVCRRHVQAGAPMLVQFWLFLVAVGCFGLLLASAAGCCWLLLAVACCCGLPLAAAGCCRLCRVALVAPMIFSCAVVWATICFFATELAPPRLPWPTTPCHQTSNGAEHACPRVVSHWQRRGADEFIDSLRHAAQYEKVHIHMRAAFLLVLHLPQFVLLASFPFRDGVRAR